MTDQIIALLGRAIDDVPKDNVIVSFKTRPKKLNVGGTKCLVLADVGLDFVADRDGIVESIFLHAEGHEGHKAFPGSLQQGLRFSDSQEDVRKRLGQPASTGGGMTRGPLGRRPVVDRYHRSNHAIEIQYVEGEGAMCCVVIFPLESPTPGMKEKENTPGKKPKAKRKR